MSFMASSMASEEVPPCSINATSYHLLYGYGTGSGGRYRRRYEKAKEMQICYHNNLLQIIRRARQAAIVFMASMLQR